jgi:type II secretory pathway component PulJ
VKCGDVQAVNAMRIQGEMSISHAILEERAQRDIAVQQALAQMRAETQQEHTVTGDDKIAYTVTWSSADHSSVQLVDSSVDLDK